MRCISERAKREAHHAAPRTGTSPVRRNLARKSLRGPTLKNAAEWAGPPPYILTNQPAERSDSSGISAVPARSVTPPSRRAQDCTRRRERITIVAWHRPCARHARHATSPLAPPAPRRKLLAAEEGKRAVRPPRQAVGQPHGSARQMPGRYDRLFTRPWAARYSRTCFAASCTVSLSASMTISALSGSS